MSSLLPIFFFISLAVAVTSEFPYHDLPETLLNLLPAGGNANFFFQDMLEADIGVDRKSGYSRGPGHTNMEDCCTNISQDSYFFQQDLHPGRKFPAFQFQPSALANISFLPTQVAEAIPFATRKFSQILDTFSLEEASLEAHIMRTTIETCEAPADHGEEKFCATSLESLVNMSVAKLGKGARALSTEIEKAPLTQELTIRKGVKRMGKKAVACHKMRYPYAVFYCHSIAETESYKVPLVAADGTRAMAIATCHKDTSSWNPNHVSFKLLKVKPGTVPICHFLSLEGLLWLPKN